MYNSTIWDHFRHPRNRAPMENPDAVGESRYHRCGDRLRLMLRLDDGLIAEARFEAFGCGPVVAMASVGTEMITGLPVEEALTLSAFTLNDALGGLPVSKRHAILMFLESLHEALGSHQTKTKTNEI